jgi:phenylpropionate dioxygenase-like ring-hydroxylating dioxygenase large terminal subunit
MTDLANVSALTRTPAQLPIDWYFDPRIAQIEQNILFERGPGYVGHELMVPEPGDYRALDWMNNAKVLVRNQAGVQLLSNVCRHRQSIMLKGSGHAQNIVCPLHRWTYDMSGKLLGAPHFPGNPCLDLDKTALTGWNGLQFAGPRDPNADLASLGVLADLDFSGYKLDRVMRHEYSVNWKTFIEVYLEDYHVGPFHPGLGQFVNADDLKWEFGNWYSVQTVGLNQALGKPGPQPIKSGMKPSCATTTARCRNRARSG